MLTGNLMKRQYNEVPQAACESAGSPYNPTLRERLITQKANLTQQLANVDAAIDAIDRNPNFEEVLNVLGKVGY